MSIDSHMPPVAVVILNWNGKHYLEKFLPSLMASTYPNMKVYVADNGSTDDSVNFVLHQYPHIHVISSLSNEGFAEGYNRALKSVNEEYLVLLNSDIEVDPSWLESVVTLWGKDKNIAAIQPKIRDYNNKSHFEYAGAAGGWIDNLGYPFSRGRIFDVLEEDNGQYDQPSPIFWASGAALCIRHSAFKEVGGFDAYFFAHQEEIDLCWRLQLAGYSIMSCPASVVYHIGGGTLPKTNPQKVYLNFRNNLIMLWKNLDFFKAIGTVSLRFLLDALSAWKTLLSGQPSYFFAVMKAHFAFLGWLMFHQEESVFPHIKQRNPTGMYKGSIVWEHFVKGKKMFSEIIDEAN